MTRAIVIVVLVGLALCGCSPSREEEPQRGYPERLQWTRHPGTTSYRVQAWADLRLLFEETVADTSLALTPSLLRSMAPFDSCRIEIRAGAPPSPSRQVFWVRKEQAER